MRNLIDWLLSLIRRPEAAPVLSTQISQDCLELIKHFEGCRLTAYRDPVGVLTIGFGDTENVREGMTISADEAEQRLLRRVARDFEPAVLSAIKTSMRQCELDAMVSLAYNIGAAAFRGSTLVRLFNAGDTHGASMQFSRWDKAGGQSLKGLRRRRAAERALFDGKPLDVALKIAEATP